MLLSVEKIIVDKNFEEPLMHIYNDPEEPNLKEPEEEEEIAERKCKGIETYKG